MIFMYSIQMNVNQLVWILIFNHFQSVQSVRVIVMMVLVL